MNEQVEELLISYKIAVTEIRRALKEAGLSERQTDWILINLPDFTKMLPEDVLDFLKELRVKVILYLSKLGFSTREIEKRLKGDSYGSVQNVIEAERKEGKKATLEEVSKNV